MTTRKGRWPTLPDRFWPQVQKGEDCWIWTGLRITGGYGKLTLRGTTTTAHRVSWELHNGPVPDGMFVLHTCDNPPCVRPDHLFLGTPGDNMADMIAKGRARLHQPHFGDANGTRRHPPFRIAGRFARRVTT